MKRVPLLIAAMVPLAVGATEKDLSSWDVESVKGDKRVTDIMDAEVYTADGREIGSIKDVLFEPNGEVSLLIESNGRQVEGDMRAAGRDIETPADPRDTDVPENAEVAARHNQADASNVSQESATSEDFQYSESETLMRTAGGDRMTGGALAKLAWDEASYDADRDAIMLETDEIEFSDETRDRRVSARDGEDAEWAGEGVRFANGELMARSVLGMEVNLEDAESFGRVEDVLITDDGEASAFVVDSWDLTDKQRHAIPADIDAVDPRAGAVRLSYSAEELDELEEFDFDDLEASRM